VPAFGCKLFPVMFIKVPAGADFGLKSLMVGSELPDDVTLTVAVATFPATSVPCTDMVFSPFTRTTLQLETEFVRAATDALQVTFASADNRSVAVPVTLSSAGVTEEPSAGEVIFTDGGDLSMFRATDVLALLPP